MVLNGQGKEKEMTGKIAFVVMAVMILSAFAGMAQQTEKEKAAVKAAEKWLSLVDAGNYKDSYQQASGFFKNAAKQDQWEQFMVARRKPLGKLISRKISMKGYKTSLPGAPDGQYVVIVFASSFEKEKSVDEQVTCMLEKDGQWRVAGYAMKPGK